MALENMMIATTFLDCCNMCCRMQVHLQRRGHRSQGDKDDVRNRAHGGLRACGRVYSSLFITWRPQAGFTPPCKVCFQMSLQCSAQLSYSRTVSCCVCGLSITHIFLWELSFPLEQNKNYPVEEQQQNKPRKKNPSKIFVTYNNTMTN